MRLFAANLGLFTYVIAAEMPRKAFDGTIELSPFVVQSSRDTGYVATDTVAGSRLNTALVDTSAAIDIMTLEFLEDIAATTLEEARRGKNGSTNSR